MVVVLNRVYNSMQQWNSNSHHHYQLENNCYCLPFSASASQLVAVLGLCHDDPSRILKGAGGKSSRIKTDGHQGRLGS